MKLPQLILLMCLTLVACHDQNRSKVSAKELVQSRKIKKILEADLLIEGEKLGRELVLKIDSIFSYQDYLLDSSICDQLRIPVLDSLALKYDVQIVRLTQTTLNKSDLEIQLMEAYQFNYENEYPMYPATQRKDLQTILYTYPMDTTDPVSQWCKIEEGRIPGIWSIRIPVKTIVNRM